MASLEQTLSSIRIELSDRDKDMWQDDELIRAIEKTVSLMSRLIPKRGMVTGTIESSWIVGEHYLDISSILSDYIRIEKVEYPTGMSPLQVLTCNPIGDYLQFRVDPHLTVGDGIRIIYLGAWTPPTHVTPGDYPDHLNDVVVIGAAGQSLIFKAENLLQQASSAFETLSVPTAYTFVKPTAPSLPVVPTAPTAPTLSFTAAESAMNAVEDEIDAAKNKLDSGELVINAGTRGENVAQNYGMYGSIVMDGAGHRVNESIARLRQVENILNKYSAEVTAFGSETNAYANNVSALVSLFRSEGELENIGASVYTSEVNAYVARINGQKAKADALLDIAGRFLASGQAKINEFLAALGYKPEFFKNKASMEQRA